MCCWGGKGEHTAVCLQSTMWCLWGAGVLRRWASHVQGGLQAFGVGMSGHVRHAVPHCVGPNPNPTPNPPPHHLPLVLRVARPLAGVLSGPWQWGPQMLDYRFSSLPSTNFPAFPPTHPPTPRPPPCLTLPLLHLSCPVRTLRMPWSSVTSSARSWLRPRTCRAWWRESTR